MEGIQEDEVQIVENGLCVPEPVRLKISKNAVETLWILYNLVKKRNRSFVPASPKENQDCYSHLVVFRQVVLVH